MTATPLVLLCGACLTAGLPAPARAAAADERILVVPFENVRREARFYWLTEASAVLVSADLHEMGTISVGRDQRLRAFEQLQLPPSATLSEATIIRVGQLMGVSQVVVGRFTVDDGVLTVRARTIRLDTGRARPEVTESGPLADLFAVMERVARGLMPPGLSLPDRLEVDHGTLPTFESYVKGLLAETPGAQVRFLDEALRIAPAFAPARLALWQVYTAQGDHVRAAEAVQAIPSSSPVHRRARFLLALSRLQLKQYDEAFQIFKALLDQDPTPALLNDLGVVQLRRGATPQTGKATYYFTKAAEADREDPDYAFNVGYAYWLDHDQQAAIYWLKEAVRRHPADGDAHFVLGAALHATGATVEADREKELAHQLSSVYAEWDQRPGVAAEPVPRGLERTRDDLDAPRSNLVDAVLASGEQTDQRELAGFYLDGGRRLYEQQQDREAVDELKRSLYLEPYQAEAHLLLGRVYLRMGRTKEAIEALKIAVWCRETAAGHALLGEGWLQAKDPAAARVELQKALALDPASPEARALAAKIGSPPRP